MPTKEKILGAVFLGVVCFSAWKIGFVDRASAVVHDVVEEKPITEEEELILESLPYKTSMVELNGAILKVLGTRSYYNTEYGMNITTDGYDVGRYDATTGDYEVEQMIALKEYLDEKGIQLLYVNEPVKYIDDEYYRQQFGGESFTNRNIDSFLNRLRDNGISCLDLREEIRSQGMDPMAMFYRTDHHWTVPAAKWAAEMIARRLNEEFGYQIDLSLYDPDTFYCTEHENFWLGEQGRMVAKSYIGLDNYTILEPQYETRYRLENARGETIREEGDFNLFVNKDLLLEADNYYEGLPLYYTYGCHMRSYIHNLDADYGEILVLGDSYEQSMIPFLSLGVRRISCVSPRDMYGGVINYIEEGNFDTVIVAYTQFMVGAHGDKNNANYWAFTWSE